MSMVRVGAAVAVRPRLWGVALRTWRRTTPAGWWLHRPFLPVPAPEYLRFRLLTQYGDSNARANAADVVNYLAWCRSQP